MKTKNLLIAVGIAAVLPFSLAAKPADPPEPQGEANGHGCTLANNSTYANPGEMFQHLRTRTSGGDAGNPKEIVDAYPGSFSNVGDLIAKKCGN